MNATPHDLLTTYWPQMVAIATLIAFFVGRVLDLRSRRVGHKQELFQQHRIDVIMAFMKEYNRLQMLYRNIAKADSNTIVIDKSSLSEQTERLYSAYFYLRWFLDPLEMARYVHLMTAMNQLLKDVEEKNTKECQDLISSTLQSNNENIKVITELFRKNSKRHYAIEM